MSAFRAENGLRRFRAKSDVSLKEGRAIHIGASPLNLLEIILISTILYCNEDFYHMTTCPAIWLSGLWPLFEGMLAR